MTERRYIFVEEVGMEVPVQGIGPRIRDLRKKRKLTQPQLASLVGVGADTVSKHERGDMGVSAQTLFAYAQALETTADFLAGDSPDLGSGRPGPKPGLRPVSKGTRGVPMALAMLLNDGRCNPITDDEMTHLSRHLDDGNSPELDDLEIHLLAHRAERDRTEDAVQAFRNAVRRARGGPPRSPNAPTKQLPAKTPGRRPATV
jgi:transcriptional regulator with XRE-family HTH domain